MAAIAFAAGRLPLLFILITFLSIPTSGNLVKSQSPPCPDFDCGNGLTLRYPFHPKINESSFCGYPNLAISCTNNQPILHISENPYTVKTLNISDSSITVAYGSADDDAASATCPVATHAFTLDSDSPLSFNISDNKIIRFYYNCTVYPPSAASIKCLQRGAKHSYAFLKGSEPEFDWVRYCESDVIVPVIGDVGDELRNALKLGFKLTWKSVDRSCQVCEGSGGFCGYNSNGVDHQFLCLCSINGRHSSLSCHVSGEVSKASKSIYVAIGSVIIGGVLAIIIVIFFINKMKIRVQKHGFNRLPTTQGK